jgi:membrane protein DedA with SNARE-associated domain
VDTIGQFATSAVEHFGYIGLFLTLIVNCMGVPIASELTLPLAGIAARNGQLDLAYVIVTAVIAQLAGFSMAYYLARREGLPLLEHYGKFIFIKRKQIVDFQKLMRKHGNFIVLIGLCMPGVHGYMGYPPGLEKMKYRHFLLLAFFGTTFWTLILVGLGYLAGSRLAEIEKAFSGMGALVVITLVVMVFIWYSRRHWVRKNGPVR